MKTDNDTDKNVTISSNFFDREKDNPYFITNLLNDEVKRRVNKQHGMLMGETNLSAQIVHQFQEKELDLQSMYNDDFNEENFDFDDVDLEL